MTLMGYDDALKYIHGTVKFGRRSSLSRIYSLLELLDNPQEKLKYVHITGTNGKGSTASFISSILIEANLKVGLFTSPYIQRFSERIKICNDEISDEDITRYANIIKEKIDLMISKGLENPTEFDILTTIAILYFLDKKCDIVILEVGIGGIIDSTNIIPHKEVAVITSISFDHMEYLGQNLEEIAEKKAGIITNDIDVVLSMQIPEVYNVIKKVCDDKNSRMSCLDISNISPYKVVDQISIFSYKEFKNLKIKLLGDFQRCNASLAIEVCEILDQKGYNISRENIFNGLSKAVWPGRFEILCQEPLVIIDGAHNVQGVEVLIENLKIISKGKKIVFITGVLRDKDYKNMLSRVVPISKMFFTVKPHSLRALDQTELAKYLLEFNQKVVPCENVEAALEKALELTTKEDMVCIFGSLYFIGDARNYFGF